MRLGLLGAAALFAAVATTTFGAPSAFAAPKAPPAPPPAEVEVAESLYSKLDYEKANDVAERVVKKSNLTHDQLVRAYRVLAVTYAVLDKESEAKDAFLQLLTYDPDYQIDPNLGPKVNNPFMEARGAYRQLASKPGIEVSTQVTTGGGTLRVVTRDPTHIVKKVNVGWRWLPNGEYTTSSVAAASEGVLVDVGPAPNGRTRLDYYAQALDDHDGAAMEAGSSQVPKSAFAEAGPPPSRNKGTKKIDDPNDEGGSVFGSPVFWVITTAVLAGGATAAYFALRPGTPDKATLTPVIYCGTDRCN